MNATFELVNAVSEPIEKPVPNPLLWAFIRHTDYVAYKKFLGTEGYLVNLAAALQVNPENLGAHVQRICYCYQEKSADWLYAALLDFLLCLKNKQADIARRMVAGSIGKLEPAQLDVLKKIISGKITDLDIVPGNPFSLFSKGLIGQPILVNKVSTVVSADVNDPLELANDAINYSQLPQAIAILEDAILMSSPNRIELHELLLHLYKMTNNRQRFQETWAELQAFDLISIEEAILELWRHLETSFR